MKTYVLDIHDFTKFEKENKYPFKKLGLSLGVILPISFGVSLIPVIGYSFGAIGGALTMFPIGKAAIDITHNEIKKMFNNTEVLPFRPS